MRMKSTHKLNVQYIFQIIIIRIISNPLYFFCCFNVRARNSHTSFRCWFLYFCFRFSCSSFFGIFCYCFNYFFVACASANISSHRIFYLMYAWVRIFINEIKCCHHHTGSTESTLDSTLFYKFCL